MCGTIRVYIIKCEEGHLFGGDVGHQRGFAGLSRLGYENNTHASERFLYPDFGKFFVHYTLH